MLCSLNKFPHNYKIYKDACKKGSFKTGEVLVGKDGDLMDQKVIINFPTKEHWRGKSKYEYIETGLKALRSSLIKHDIKSVAIPPFSCRNGGLDWNRVKALIENAMKDLDCQIYVYTPNDKIKTIPQQ